MALDINGYSNVFKTFVDFAQQRVDANDENAIADAHVQKPLVGRKTLAITQSLTDEVHKWTRGMDEWTVNDRTRALFKKAIADMFGGESKIPASVKKAMIMSDYGTGRPLTARRIMAVKAAIDADGTAAIRAARIELESFASREVEGAALAMGYTKGELPKLARAAHFLAEATGKSEMDAMKEVAEPDTKANRLMGYGGRFMTNAENFEKGLRLLDLFATWYDDLCTSLATIDKTGAFASNRDYSTADTPSKLNADTNIVKQKTRHTMEKFIFEALGADRNAKLGGTDPEALFGMKNNDASRFIAQDFGHSCLNTVANIPPAKRAVVFKVFNLFCSLAETPADHQRPARDRYLTLGHRLIMLPRVLRHLDAILALEAQGKLTAKNVIKTCFPDMVAAKATGNWDLKAVSDFIVAVCDEIDDMPDKGGQDADIAGPLHLLMQTTGCTLKEGVESLRSGKPFPRPPYIADGQLDIKEFETIEGARGEIEGDLGRPDNYSFGKDKPGLLKPGTGFGFIFPGEDRFATDGTEAGQRNIAKVGDKVEALCGRVHKKQASAVLMMLSQSGLGPIRGGLRPYGVQSGEHSPVDYTLTRDENTGAVTIKYSSPVELPFRFEWTATVDVDGKVSTTPLKFSNPAAQLDANTAKAMVAEREQALGVELTGAQRDEAASLLSAYGTNMLAKNAKLFAGFTVQLVRTAGTAERKAQIAADTANSIREWRDFAFGDVRNVAFKNAAKSYASNTIREYMQPNKADRFKDNVFTAMRGDANRGTFVLNGTTYSHQPANEVISAFKTLVPDAKKQKALSSYLNQLCFETFMLPSTGLPYSTGVDAIKLQGANMLVNRNMGTGLYMFQILGTRDHDIVYELQVSPDGKTATITESISADLAASSEVGLAEPHFGKVALSQRLVIDLEPEIPEVTDYQLSQSMDV